MKRAVIVVGVALTISLGGCVGNSGPQTKPTTTSREHVGVPRLIGERPREARRTLAARGLKPTFVVLTSACATVPPAGHVVAQRPRPGTPAHRGEDVFMQTGCAPRGPCRPAQIGLRVGGVPGLTGGGVAVGATLGHVSGPACELDANVRVTIRDANGAFATGIRGSPSNVRFRRALGPAETLSAHLGWMNWCGPGGRFELEASSSDAHPHTASSRVEPPSCESRRSASVLFFPDRRRESAIEAELNRGARTVAKPGHRRSPGFPAAVYPPPVKPERRGAVKSCPNPRGVEALGPDARAGAVRALRSFNGRLEHDKRYADRAFWPDLRRNKHLEPFARERNGHPAPWGVRGSSGPPAAVRAPPGAPCSPRVVGRTWAITLGPIRGPERRSASIPITYYLLQRHSHRLVWYWY